MGFLDEVIFGYAPEPTPREKEREEEELKEASDRWSQGQFELWKRNRPAWNRMMGFPEKHGLDCDNSLDVGLPKHKQIHAPDHNNRRIIIDAMIESGYKVWVDGDYICFEIQ